MASRNEHERMNGCVKRNKFWRSRINSFEMPRSPMVWDIYLANMMYKNIILFSTHTTGFLISVVTAFTSMPILIMFTSFSSFVMLGCDAIFIVDYKFPNNISVFSSVISTNDNSFGFPLIFCVRSGLKVQYY